MRSEKYYERNKKIALIGVVIRLSTYKHKKFSKINRTLIEVLNYIDEGHKMAWALLAIAIIAEVFGTTMLKLSVGFTKLLPSLAFILSYGISFYLFSIALKELSIGSAYATWAGVGLVLTAVVGILFFNEKIDLIGIIGLTFILVGIVLVNVFSKMNGSN